MAEQHARAIYALDGWEIDLARRELRSRGVSVPIGSRAFEILEVLVRSGGELIGKYRLMEHIWPGAIVEENTLQFHISAIRKALGADRSLLKTESGRGYRLLGDWDVWRMPDPGHDLVEGRSRQIARTNVPRTGSALIGRSALRQRLLDVLSAYRIVTLTGPGGIGKSVLALEVARSTFATFEGDVWLVELASLSDPALVPAAVSVALELRIEGREISAEGVARALGRRRLLLVLDNCDHLVDAVATLVEAIVRLCPGASVLATSREILRIEGEYAYRIPPLEVPPPGEGDQDAIDRYSAVQLFTSRLTEVDAGSSAHSGSMALIASICRRLDGIPLAIEFAVARVAMLGLRQTADLLNDRFSLLTSGRRTALPRHRTMRATLDWSYELLPQAERILLQRLAIFSGGFTFEAAMAIVAGAEAASAVAEGIASLAAKSLISLDASVPSGRWRLLETTRAYALDKLAESDDADQVARRHAQFFRDMLRPVMTGPLVVPDDLPVYAREIDNLRAALNWAFAPGKDNADIGIGIAAAAVPVFLATSMLPECQRWSERALLALDAGKRGTAEEMCLQAGLGYSLMYMYGGGDGARMALDRSLAIAEECRNVLYQMWLLGALNVLYFRNGNCRMALECAKRNSAVAQAIGDPAAFASAHFMLANALYLIGDLGGARAEFEATLEDHARVRHAGQAYLAFDIALPARLGLAHTLYLEGCTRQAVEQAQLILDDARHIEHPATLSILLTRAFLLFLSIGDLQTVEQISDWFISTARTHSMGPHMAIGRGLKAVLAIRRGDLKSGIDVLQSCVQELPVSGYSLMAATFNLSLAEGLAANGRIAESISRIDAGLHQVEINGDFIYMPELLRMKANLLLSAAQPRVEEAEMLFRRSLALSRRQGARVNELRTATDLARLMAAQGRCEDARALLEPLFKSFAEGPDTNDLTAAEHLLKTLR